MPGLSLVDARRLVRAGAGLQTGDALFTDTVLNDLVNEAQAIAEGEVRPPWRQAIASINVAAGVVAVPGDWAETKAVFLASTADELLEVPVTDLQRVLVSTGTPMAWSQEADKISFRPVPADGTAMTVVYYRVPPTLAADGDVTLMPRDLAISVIVPKVCELVSLRQGDRVMADAKAASYAQAMSRLRRRARGSTRPMRVRIRPGSWI